MTSHQPTPQTGPYAPSAEVDFAPLGYIAPNAPGRTIDIVRFALSIWKPMAIGLGGGILAGFLAYLYLGPVYDAATRILVSEKSSIPTDSHSLNITGGRGEHVTLIKSDAIIHRALQDHGLKELSAFKGGADPIQDIIDGLKVSRSAGQETSKDNVFDIGYTNSDPATARKVVEAIIAAYRDFLDERHTDNVADLSQTLRGRENELKVEIEGLEHDHVAWRDKQPHIFSQAPVVSTANGPMIVPNRYEQELDRISKLLQANGLAQHEAEAKITTLQEMLANKDLKREVVELWIMHSLSTSSPSTEGAQANATGTTMLAGPPSKAALDNQLLMARMTESRLLNLLGPQHDDVIKIRKQIDTILGFYRQQGMAPPHLEPLGNDARGTEDSQTDLPSAYMLTLQNHLRFLKNQETALRGQWSESEDRAKQASMLELEDNRRKDQIASKKKELENVKNSVINFKQTKDQEGYTVQSIAQVRVTKSLKQVLKIVGACGAMGIVFVFALAYFREWYDTSVRDEEEIRKSIGTPVLGSVPGFKLGHPAERAAVQASGIQPAVCYYHRPGSREAEAYRTVRTTLFAATRETGARVIQVSSAEPGDGKTTSAVNLAVAIAQSGKKVLLIDADLRRPTVHLLLGLQNDIGLTEVLHGDLQWETAVQATKIDGLSVLPSGRCPENPAELLSLASLGHILREARTDYEFILVDTPPVLAVTDPCIISPHTDGLLLVVRMQKNKRAALVRTKEALDTHGVRIYGVVANDLALEVGGYGSGKYNEYYRDALAAGPVNVEAQPRETVGV